MTDNPFFKPENPKASQQLLSLAQRRGIPGNVFGHKIFWGTCLDSDLSQNERQKGRPSSSIFAIPNNTVVPLLRILKNLQNVP